MLGKSKVDKTSLPKGANLGTVVTSASKAASSAVQMDWTGVLDAAPVSLYTSPSPRD